MKLLVVAATESEIAIARDQISKIEPGTNEIHFLITGVGMLHTTYKLTKELARKNYDFVLQAGVGGSFDSSLPLGELVMVADDTYGDLGAEDHDNFLDIFELGLLGRDASPFQNGKLITPPHELHNVINLRKASGLTVNAVSGSERTIALRREKFQCTTESMEGAAFHYVCLRESVPFAQVRAISNYVIPRDKSLWQMKEAIINLNKWLVAFVSTIINTNSTTPN